MATLMWFETHEHDTTQILIVNQTKLDKMTVSKSLKKLVSLGFINPIEHKTDTRAKNVTLTDTGIKMICTLVPLVESIDAKFFNPATKPEEKQLTSILAKLIRESHKF